MILKTIKERTETQGTSFLPTVVGNGSLTLVLSLVTCMCLLLTRALLSKDEGGHIRHSTSGLLHQMQGVRVWLPSYLQPEEILHLFQLLKHWATVSLPSKWIDFTLQVVVAVF